MKKLIAAAALLMLTVPAIAGAVELKGMWGLGFFDPRFPLGARFWLAPKWGLDAGIRFDNTGGDVPEVSQFGIDIGAPFVLVNTENAVFYVRPGLNWEDLDNDVSAWAFRGSLCVEYWFTQNFSIQAGHGFTYSSTTTGNPAPVGDVTETNLATDAFGITSLGFHWYFLPKK